jgi:hypothetical protein
MKNKPLLLLLFCTPTVSLWLTVGAIPAPQWGGRDAISVTGAALLLPPPELDFSDLDVRDAENHPISSVTAHEKLEALFRENLVDLTVYATLHPAAQSMGLINLLSALFDGSILKEAIITFDLLVEAIPPSTKRFVHNVDNLWISISVEISPHSLSLATPILFPASHLLPLRI